MYRSSTRYVIGKEQYALKTNWRTIRVPAECDVHSQFVDFSLVRQAVVASVGKKRQPFIVGEYGVAEAIRASFQPNKGLRCARWRVEPWTTNKTSK